MTREIGFRIGFTRLLFSSSDIRPLASGDRSMHNLDHTRDEEQKRQVKRYLRLHSMTACGIDLTCYLRHLLTLSPFISRDLIITYSTESMCMPANT